MLGSAGRPRDGADAVLRRDSSTQKQGDPVHEAITYLTNHADRFDYATARALGLPIGSGAVEATCKTVVSVRMKRAGRAGKTTRGDMCCSYVCLLRAMLGRSFGKSRCAIMLPTSLCGRQPDQSRGHTRVSGIPRRLVSHSGIVKAHKRSQGRVLPASQDLVAR